MRVEVIDLTGDSPPPTKRTKHIAEEAPIERAIRIPEELPADTAIPIAEPSPPEKRLRRWRKVAPQAYHVVHSRAVSQRMFVLDRRREHATHPDDPRRFYPVETVSLAGTTGNIYTVIIDREPSCDCPHALQGNQCKHIAYVMTRVLRAPTHLQYQLGLLSNELEEIFAGAPALPSIQGDATAKDGLRKPIEGECPICCEDFASDDSGREKIVYCRASCGNNIHRSCFEKWAATKAREGNVTCPFCRTPWQNEAGSLQNVARRGRVNAEGYVNVAGELGLSGARDYSSYNDFFISRHFGSDYTYYR